MDFKLHCSISLDCSLKIPHCMFDHKRSENAGHYQKEHCKQIRTCDPALIQNHSMSVATCAVQFGFPIPQEKHTRVGRGPEKSQRLKL